MMTIEGVAMIPVTVKVPVPYDYVFPNGALFLGVEPVKDFDAAGGDDQARDKETGRRLWQVRVLDLDPEAGRFGASKEVKVKIAADQQPVSPASTVTGYPPAVEFTGVTVTPYVNSQRKCTDRCRARLAWSVRAESMTALQAAAGKRADRAEQQGRLTRVSTAGPGLPPARVPARPRRPDHLGRRLVCSTYPIYSNPAWPRGRRCRRGGRAKCVRSCSRAIRASRCAVTAAGTSRRGRNVARRRIRLTCPNARVSRTRSACSTRSATSCVGAYITPPW
jgi:hypothetical protein